MLLEAHWNGEQREEAKQTIDRLEEKVKNECNENIFYWEVSPVFNYYYVNIIYSDAQGNLKNIYYVYKKRIYDKMESI